MVEETPDAATRIRELQEQLSAALETNKRLLEERLREEARRIDRAAASKALRNDFYEKDTFLATRFADWLSQAGPEYQFITPTNDLGGDVIWMYHENLGVYLPDGIPFVERSIKDIIGEDTQTGYYNDVVKHLKVNTYTDPTEFSDDPTLVVLQNGTYSISARQLYPHSHIYRAKTRIPVAYDPTADCPAVKAFLSRVAPENLAFLQEWVGYHLLKDYRFQRCVVLVGEGDNGKSTFLSLLTRFLGPENVTGQSLYRLSTNRFAPAELQGRLANIAADIGPDELKHTGTIKMLTGGDWITAEKKNRDPFKFLNYAKMSFSCNQLPKTPDETLAFYKRFLVVLFNQTIPKEEQDPQLIEKLTTPEELSGLLNWALEGLTRLLEQGCFTEAGTALERKELYKRMSDPITGFVSDCVEEDLEARVVKQDVFSAYIRYCRDRGAIPGTDREFWIGFKSLVYVKEAQETINGIKGTRVLQGINLSQATQHTQHTQDIPLRPLESFSGERIENGVYPVYPVSGEAPQASEEEPEANPLPTPTVNPGALTTALSRLVLALGVMERKTGEAVKGEDLLSHLKWDQASFDRILGVAMKDGTIYSPRPGCYRRTSP